MDFRFTEISSYQTGRKHKLFGLLGKMFRKYGYDVVRMPDYISDMLSVEQAVNLYHFINQTLVFDVPGELVELGSYTGTSAINIQRQLENYPTDKKLHLFDSFSQKFHYKGLDTLEMLKTNFKREGLQLPVIHKGDFKDTIPGQLPEKISFVHMDCGFGDTNENHKQLVLFLLNAVYPRMSKNAIGVIMDYHIPGKTIQGYNSNPGYKLACDEFFKDKPEKVYILYGGYFSHGYFRKEIKP